MSTKSSGFAKSIVLSIALSAVPLAAVEPPDRDLRAPPVEQIPREELQAACGQAVANGILALFERMYAPGNDRRFIYRPIEQRKVMGYDEVEVKMARKTFTRPKMERKYKEVERLVPKKDEYGTVVGYEKKKMRVLVSEKVVGTEQYERLVQDPNGSIVQIHKRPIYDQTGTPLIPQGWFGVNAMGLYVLGKAGLGERSEVQTCALYLEAMIRNDGMPDHTWDLAWLAMGLAQVPGEDHRNWSRKCAEKLLDGQVSGRTRGLGGLWGPVSINHDLVAKFFGIELELRKRMAPLEQQAASGKDDVPTRNAIKNLAQLNGWLNEVIAALDQHTQHGKRLASCTQTLNTDEYKYAGLPYYIYNRVVADVDSTAVVALAFSELTAMGIMPEETERPRPAGKALIAPVRTRTVLPAAYNAIKYAEERGGYYTAIDGSGVNTAYDRLGTIGNVPFKGTHPELFAPESLRSRVHGYVARRLFAELAGQVERDADLAGLEAKAAEALELALDKAGDRKRSRFIFQGERLPLEDLLRQKGILRVPRWEERPAEELPVGHIPDEREFLLGAMVLHRPAPGSEGRRHLPLHTRLAYRLLMAQESTGAWDRGGARPYAASNAQYALALENIAESRYKQLDRQVNVMKKPLDDKARPLEFSSAVQNLNRSQSRAVHLDVYTSCAALAYLQDNLDAPVPLEEVQIDALVERLQAKLAAGQDAVMKVAEIEAIPPGERSEQQRRELEEAKTTVAGGVVHAERDNEALVDLWAAIMKRMGKELPVPPPPEPPAEAPAEPKDGSAVLKRLAYAKTLLEEDPEQVQAVLDYLEEVEAAAVGTTAEAEVKAYIEEVKAKAEADAEPTFTRPGQPAEEKPAEEKPAEESPTETAEDILEDVLK